MAVFNPSKGDLWDRYLVLDLKIRHGWAAGKNVQHFRSERAGIEKVLKSTFQIRKLGKLVAAMTNVHQRLWDAADRQQQIRDHYKESPFVLSALAAELATLNRQRTKLKEKIEKLLGEYKGADKI